MREEVAAGRAALVEGAVLGIRFEQRVITSRGAAALLGAAMDTTVGAVGVCRETTERRLAGVCAAVSRSRATVELSDQSHASRAFANV